MDIIVCVKRVPDTSEADLAIDRSGLDIKKDDLAFDINEWDNYAVEEAIQIKENLGGTVTVIALGDEEANEVLRRCLAMGADEAVRLTDPSFEGSDGEVTAKILARAIKTMKYDLILAGAVASDNGWSQVGPALAQYLGISHAAYVIKIDASDGSARVHRELEGGLEEVVDIKLPALFTIQTGINEPRYVSIAGVRRVAKKEIAAMDRQALGLSADEVGTAGSASEVVSTFLPPAGKMGEMIEGRPEEAAAKLAEILKGKGLVV